MKHKTTTLTILGFIGGIVFARYIAPPPVSAAQPAIIEARSFVLEDATGRKRGEMTVARNGRAEIRLYDDRGRAIWSAPGPALVPAEVR